MSTRNPTDFSVSQLKEKLRERGLSSAGNKTELISRLNEADPSCKWIEETLEMPETSAIQGDKGESEARAPISISQYERELEIFRREKELAERELQFARREIELLKGMQQLNTAEQDQGTRRENTFRDLSKASITVIADLLGYFDGSSGDYEIWEKQLKLLKTTYHLSDEYVKILIGMRLKGKASSWMHSKPQHIELPVDILLSEMREMYDHRPSRMLLRKQFEERIWKKEETFHQYVHEKIILANRIPINEDEIIDYIIEGIPVVSLRDQAHIGKFTTKAALLQAFEKVTLKDKILTNDAKKEEQQKQRNGTQRHRGGEKIEKKNTMKSETEKRCFNCGLRNHVSINCPTKTEGPKCFQCGERGHIAAKCTKNQSTVGNINSDIHTVRKKYSKEVEINGHKVLALIDTGSDICLLRSDKYIKLGSPQLNPREIQFRGVSRFHPTMYKYNNEQEHRHKSIPFIIRCACAVKR